MKEDFENTTIDAEKLLREKSWEQLTAAERKVANELFSGEAEYERMRAMVHQLRSSAGNSNDDELIPSGNVRKNLLNAFEDEQRRRRVLWWNSLGFLIRDRLRFDIPAVRYAFAGVILIAGVFTVLRLINTTGNSTDDVLAKSNSLQTTDSVAEQVALQNVVPDQTTGDTIAVNIQNAPVVQDNKDNIRNNDDADRIVNVPIQQPVPDGNQVAPLVPEIIDTTARIAFANGNDSSEVATMMAVVGTAVDSSICCGATALLLSPTATSPAYTWTNNASLSPVGVNVNATAVTYFTLTPPTSRSLAADEEVINVFWSLR